MADEPIVVLTWNILNHHEGDAGFTRRFGVIARLILDLAPDVVCLQEVPSPEAARKLAALLSERKRWAMRVACTELRRPDGWHEHLAIIHRGTMKTASRVAASTGEHIAIGLTLAGSGLTINSVHLNPHSAEVRHEQAATLRDALPRTGPLLVGGDLNAAPNGGTLAVLREELECLAPEEGSPPTFPTPLREGNAPPPAILDYILGRGVRVLESGLVGAEAVEAIWASDHAGVWARVEIGR